MLAGPEGTAVFHEGFDPTDRGLFRDEVRKGQVQVGIVGFQAALDFREQVRDVPKRHLASAGVENLKEPAHMGALEVVGQAHGHVHPCDGVLDLVLPIQDLDRVGQVLDAHLVDGQGAIVRLVGVVR